MRDEIAAAVVFITRLVKKNEALTPQQITQFSDELTSVMVEKFKNHWYISVPNKGQAYRCIRVNETEPIDTMLEQAAIEAGLRYQDLKLPLELTLWIDPLEVTCRFGESNSSVFAIATFDGTDQNNTPSINLDDLIQRQNHARNRVIYRTRTNAPSGLNNNDRTVESYQGNDIKLRHNNFNHQYKSRQFPPQQKSKVIMKYSNNNSWSGQTKKTDRFHWTAKNKETTVEA